MKRIGILISLAITLAILTLPAYSAPCSNATLKGSYGFQDTQQGYDGNWYLVGLRNFDGTGHGTVPWDAFQRNDRFVGSSGVFSFTYTVAPNCTFTINEDVLIYSGVIVEGGKQIRYVETTGTEFRMGNAVKVSSENQQ